MSQEEFYTIPGFSNYEVSKEGTIRCINYRSHSYYNRPRKTVIIIPTNRGLRGLYVNVKDDKGLKHHIRLCKLIALTFIGPLLNDNVIHFYDGNITNCNIKNLCYITKQEEEIIRFWSKVNKYAKLIEKNDPALNKYPEIINTYCREWLGSTDSSGYGLFKDSYGKTQKTHRISYMFRYGRESLNDVDVLCHKCNNTKCVNLLHLKSGTFRDNMDDREASGRTAKGDLSGSRIKANAKRSTLRNI